MGYERPWIHQVNLALVFFGFNDDLGWKCKQVELKKEKKFTSVFKILLKIAWTDWSWYGKTRVTSYDLRVVSYELKAEKQKSWDSKERV